MNIEKLENNIQSLVTNLKEDTFIFDLLLAYEQPQSSITRLQKGDYNLSKNPGEILWKKKLFFKKETEVDLHSLIDQLKSDSAIIKHHPRFIVVTDFHTLLSIDTKTADSLDIPILDLAKHYDFFLPWAGMEKSQIQSENPADIKAAERMGRLYDLILKDNPPENEGEWHALNIFLSRLLFCFFAQDTGIFADGQFTNGLASHTAQDGSNLQAYLHKLFKVLNVRERSSYPQFLQNFPYVNGGLFADEYPVPTFSEKSRKIIIECGALNWKAINPDIFGSMMQAVMHSDQRSSLGMHYTSVVNIMKVIEPLFLNDLYDELEQAGNNEKKLSKILDRLYHLRIFDPACGSGNFLIIAYKELCKLEIEILKRLLQRSKQGQPQLEMRGVRFFSNIKPSQFYGIELDDFAHETAKLSLWLAEHQMNLAFREVFGEARPTLPLQDGGNIICENATRLDWKEVCPKDEGYEIYILGNPPYLGGKLQSKGQKNDLKFLAIKYAKFKNLDYIACWFIKATDYIYKSSAELAFVSTNSICQGEQVALLWPYLFNKQVEIRFAHQSFKWTNNAKGNAGVSCVIVGISNSSNRPKWIYSGGRKTGTENINPYLTSGKNVIVQQRKNALFNLPEMVYGNMPLEGNFLKLEAKEKNSLLREFPHANKFIRPLIGGDEFLNGNERWCIWIEDDDLDEAKGIKIISERIESSRNFRKNAGEVARTLVHKAHQFRYRHEAKKSLLIVPCTSSEKRDYLQCGFYTAEYITLNSAQVIYDPSPYIFAVISTRMHMTWVRAVAGRLETRIRYSSALCYNTFPFPKITEAQKSTLENHVFQVLDQRERHSEKTMADLYDPDKMPDGLRQAHHEMDLAVEQCYRSRPFKNDEERLEYLFKLYEEMIEEENQQ